MQEATALPWVAINESDFGRTEIFYRMRRRDFKQIRYQIRDAVGESFGLKMLDGKWRQVLALPLAAG